MSDVLIKLTGLWERERRGNPGNTYRIGRLGAAKILVFKNNRKTEPSPPRERPDRHAQGQAAHEAIREKADAVAQEILSGKARDGHVQELAERFDQRPPDEVPF